MSFIKLFQFQLHAFEFRALINNYRHHESSVFKTLKILNLKHVEENCQTDVLDFRKKFTFCQQSVTRCKFFLTELINKNESLCVLTSNKSINTKKKCQNPYSGNTVVQYDKTNAVIMFLNSLIQD